VVKERVEGVGKGREVGVEGGRGSMEREKGRIGCLGECGKG